MSVNKILVNNNDSNYTHSIFDISEYTGNSYSTLSDALNDIPIQKHKGGMTIRYVPTDVNKYVQYRLTTDVWSTNTEDWAIADEGIYVLNPEFVYVKTDYEDKILYGVKQDGEFFFGAGCPQQVKSYIEDKISSLSLDEYEDIVAFLSDLEKGDKTLQTLLDEKVDKEEGKSLIDAEYADSVSQIENPEFAEVHTDTDGKISYGVKQDGDFYFGAGVPSQIQEKKVDKEEGKSLIDADYASSQEAIKNPEWLQVTLDREERVLGGRKQDGTVVENCDVEFNSGLEVADGCKITAKENPQWAKVTTDANGKELDGIQTDNTKVINTNVKLNGNLSISENSQIDNNIKQAIRKALLSETAKDRYVLPEYSNIVATFDNVIVRFIDNGGTQYLQFSKNAGYSWSEPIENTIGDIVHTHIFSNGTVLLCGYNGCYWTDDYTELHQSTVYDLDGSVFVGTDRKSFYSQMYHDRYFFVNGVEMEVFGEYLIEDDDHPRSQLQVRIWYTTDFGQTIKCAFKSGTSQIGGNIVTIRHFHYVGYCDATNKFYISTGDTSTETYFLEAAYDTSLDTWSFNIIGQGSQYKFGYMWFDERYIYILTDFTSGLNRDKKGILRAPLSGLNNYSNYINLYVCPDNWEDIAIVNIIIDVKGNKILFPDYRGYGKIWVSTDNYNFRKTTLNKNELIGFNTIGPNVNGDIYVLTSASDNMYAANQKQYNLTTLLRENGIYNFMH